MRQGQQNRRGRGRNNNRKGHHSNPLARSFESNGPNERIRGTPSHIAEKYVSLAREAQSSGDPVLAENYLQHAEHYSRIIMAYREQFNQPGDGGMNGGGQRLRGPGDVSEGFDEFGDDGDLGGDDGFPQPFAAPQPGHQQRPQHAEQQPMRQDRQERHQDRSERQDRQDRPFRRDQNRPRFGERGERPERQGGFGEREPREVREPRGEPQQEREPAAEAVGEPRRRDRFQQPHEQPEFLRRPVRRVRSSDSGNGEAGKNEPSDD